MMRLFARPAFWLAGGTLTLMAGVLVLGWFDLESYRGLLQEDGWAEWATFLSFVVAAGLGVAAARGASSGLERTLLLCLAVFCAFVAGEEVSWGQRLFGFAPPDVFLEHNYQQESNLHNLLKSVLDTRWMVCMVAVAWGVLAPLLAAVLHRRAPTPRPAWVDVAVRMAPPLGLLPAFLAVAVLEVVYPLTLSGELAELCLGLCFVADMSLRKGDSSAEGLRAAGFCVASLAVAALIPLAMDAWTRAHSSEATSEARSQVERLAADLRTPGVVQQLLRRRRRVHKRMFTAVRAGYLAFGPESSFLEGGLSPAQAPDSPEARRDARGYFLDPWLQPYWVRYEVVGPERGRILLYSFGANRRRDTPVRRLVDEPDALALLQGDDVGVTLEVQWR